MYFDKKFQCDTKHGSKRNIEKTMSISETDGWMIYHGPKQLDFSCFGIDQYTGNSMVQTLVAKSYGWILNNLLILFGTTRRKIIPNIVTSL